MKLDTSNVDNRQDIHVLIGNKAKSNKFECDFHVDEDKSAYIKDNTYCCSCCDCELTPTMYYSQRYSLPMHEAFVYLSAKNKTPQDPVATKEYIRQNHLRTINSEIANICHVELLKDEYHNKICLDYIKHDRSITSETINKFKIGYFPSNQKFTDTIIEKYGVETLLELGIVQKSSKFEGYYSPFKNRLIFPIVGLTGKPLGFGARDLTGKSNIKYTNSKTSDIFKKNRNLYSSGYGKSTAVTVEGYMDVVTCCQEVEEFSFHASLGVAISANQIRQLLLNPSIDKVVMCLDSDKAGLVAMKNIIQNSLSKINADKIRFALLDGKMDPDEFIKKFGSDAFIDRINTALTASEFIKITHDTPLPSPDRNLRLMEELDNYNIQP
jgi:DNA primase